jgi:hypothetical protein
VRAPPAFGMRSSVSGIGVMSEVYDPELVTQSETIPHC